jgi:outer membrane lipoprotein-sorting protein
MESKKRVGTALSCALFLLTGYQMSSGSARAPEDTVRLIENYRAGLTELRRDYLIEVGRSGRGSRLPNHLSVAFRAPNRFRFDLKDPQHFLMVSDGQYRWTYNESGNSYWRGPAPANAPAFRSWIGPFLPLQVGDALMIAPSRDGQANAPEALGRAQLATALGDRECYVLRAAIADDLLRDWDLHDGTITVWVGVRDYVNWKIEVALNQRAQGRDSAKVTATDVTKDFASEFSDSLFEFTPPSGAKKRG